MDLGVAVVGTWIFVGIRIGIGTALWRKSSLACMGMNINGMVVFLYSLILRASMSLLLVGSYFLNA